MKIKVILIGFLVCFTSCYNDKEDLLYGAVECDTEAVSFSEEIMPIISNNCSTVGCHVQGGSGVGILENYDQVKAIVDDGSFRDRVLVQMDMPPSGSLSACELQHLEEWIADGALND
ncbi:hypothetical protein NBT05_03500 [Aquimarina sp. ERC-38]|uniref:hypothetical protein n=1 Tax=Aquimarina sp. ERC-38 TaxID=2949996 RepID=UPI002246AF67|nr:hypothetical protein [Aquimarina sp. ERC-38]UZO81546.1 hypothetical protein NBT05_03500 [Aquimarina sp. ERC-38]